MTPISGRPFSLPSALAQGLVNRRIGNRLEPVPGQVSELLVAQERGQRRDTVLGADERQLAAGIGLVFQRCVRFQDGDQLLLFSPPAGLSGTSRRRSRRQRAKRAQRRQEG